MRATVLRDARLGKHARRFVWLSIDTEKPRNAAFLERFPLQVWPTLLVVDPRTEAVRARWPGGATVKQVEALLTGTADATHPEAFVIALQAAGRWEECAAAARERAPSMERNTAFALVAAAGLSCALSAPTEAPWKMPAIDSLEPLADAALSVPALAADDRAGLYDELVETRTLRVDIAGARSLAERWWTFLESERKRARTAEQRAALDSYRVNAALALGDPGRALAALTASERELPRDYNPPARTARLLLELGRFSEARGAVRRALERAYGPRKLRIYQLAAQIEERSGARAAERTVLAAALRYWAALPETHRNGRLAETLRARLARLAQND